jgi:phospholipase/carboxylesterase
MSNAKTLSPFVAVPRTASAFQHAVESFPPRRHGEARCSAFPHFLVAPVKYEKNYPYPLLVWLHDSGSSEAELFDVAPQISTRNYVAVAPRGLLASRSNLVCNRSNGRLVVEKTRQETYYDWPETEEGVSEAENLVFHSIDQALVKFNVHRRRVFLLGRGAGGTMALRVALRNPREFAGVVSIDGAFPTLDRQPLRRWREARDLPILMTTGLGSSAIPQLTPKQLGLFHTAGLTVVIRQYNERPNEKNAAETRMNKILLDVNRWTMERALNPQAPISELYQTR